MLGFQADCHTQLAFTGVRGSSALTLHGYHFTHWPISSALEQYFWMMSEGVIHFRKNWKWFAHGIKTGDREWGWLVVEDSWGERSSLDSGICGPHSRGKELTMQVILLGGLEESGSGIIAWPARPGEKRVVRSRHLEQGGHPSSRSSSCAQQPPWREAVTVSRGWKDCSWTGWRCGCSLFLV